MDPDRRDRMDIGDPVVEEQTELASTVEGNTGQVNKVMTRGKVEEIRKNKMSVNERMMTEYALITKAFKDCRDKVKGQTSLRTSGEVTVVNELFKGAIKEADKAWESVVTAVNTALDGNAVNKRESNFLKRVQLESLEQVETEMGENREELRQFRLLLDNVRELELVDDIPSLLAKVNEEREAAEKKYSEWEAMRLELQELNELAELKENDRLVDYWKDMNIELQTIREQFKELKLKIEKGEDDALVLVDSVEMLEKQVAVLEKEKRKLKDINDEQLARLIQAEDSNQGQNRMNNLNGTSSVEHAMSESQKRSENMRRQNEVLQRMRERRARGGHSQSPPDSRASPATEGRHTFTTLTSGAYLLGSFENGDGTGNSGVGGSGGNNGILGKSFGLMGNALPRLARFSGKKEDWEDFETGFLIRFGGMEASIALSLLKDNLNVEAKDVLRTIPVEEKEKGVKCVLKWLRSRLSNETPFEMIELDKMLRHQKVNGKTVGKVCEELEEWTARLHREEDKKEEARRRQLLILNGNGGGSKGGNGTSGGTNGSYRGGYSGPSRGGYSTGRGGYNNGSGQKPQQSNGYGNGGARAHSVAAAANNGRPYTNVGTGANSGPLGHNSSVNAIKTESFSRRGTEVQRHESPERSVRDVEDFFFIKRRELVKGKVNGVPVQVLLDTGADVSIISADVVDKIDGAVVEKGASPMIKDASNGVMDIIGRTILEVELEVGNRTQVGFYMLNNGLGKVIIGGKGLDDVGVELKEVRFREKTHSNGDDAIVLRDAQIGPGQLGSIWVKGSEHNTVMLESSVDQVMEGIANEVNERLKGERERMKASYDKKWENNKKYEPVVGDRVYVFKEKGDGKNPKLRIRRLIDRQSPLHWENPCPACEENPRPLSALWRACPKEFALFTCATLKEYACLRTIIEKFRNITPLRVHKLLAMGQLGDEEISEKTIEETVGNLCSHALVSLKGPDREWRFTVTDIDPRYEESYRRGLGEEVELSLGFGGIMHQPGLAITRRGGDKARWQWKVEMHSKWNEILAGWHRLQTKKTIKNLLIFWPRTMEKEDMNTLRDIVVYHTERNAWNVVIVEEPCGEATNPDYIPFLLDWSVDYPKTGKIRVIITDNAITDGTPISALERCHSWIRRDHYEFATQAWVGGRPWDIKKAEKELVEKGWSVVEDTRKRDRNIGESDVSKLSQVLQDRDRREKEEITCKGCEGVGHKIWKCTNKNNNKKIYYGRGRPASKEGDVMEPTHKKKRY
uniref:Peptidase A2 domain-containing protein n=1 Tax=Pristionchus pacificus TaxID=54126 RepID=A0A2A6C5V3_PRIPA|eukprot:PDM73592.1 hypothetical protein PRIPAC_40948 [Pristionchus pacificus]